MLFNELTVTYLFLGGTGAGMCVVLSLLECFTARESMSVRLMSAAPYESPISRISSALALPSEFFTRAWPACFVLLALGVLCLLVDVGRPERLFNLLFSPQPTAMSVGSYAIAVTLLCSGAFSAMSLLDNVEPSRALSLAIAIVGVASGLVTAVYTGVLLSSLASVLAYRTPLLPALFCVSSLSCGLAGAFAALSFTEPRHPHVRPRAALTLADGGLVLIEAALLAVYVVWMLGSEGTAAGAWALVAGDMRWLFWGGLLICGLIVPFALERFLTHGNARTQLLWIASCLLAGGLSLRICTTGLAAYDVTQVSAFMLGLGC